MTTDASGMNRSGSPTKIGPVPGFSFGTDTRERRYKYETETLGQSPGPVYNISPPKVPAPVIGYRIPEPPKNLDVPGPGAYDAKIVDPASKKTTSITWGDGNDKQRFRPEPSIGPGPAAYDIVRPFSPRIYRAKTMGVPRKDGVYSAPASPGPKYDVRTAIVGGPAFTFGSRVYKREETFSPGPIYNVRRDIQTIGGYKMKPPTTSPSPSRPSTAPAGFGRSSGNYNMRSNLKSRLSNSGELSSSFQQPKGKRDDDDDDDDRNNNNNNNGTENDNTINKSTMNPSASMRNGGGGSPRKGTFGSETRDMFYDRLMKASSVGPGPIFDVRDKGKIRSPKFSIKGKLSTVIFKEVGPGPAAYDISEIPGKSSPKYSFAATSPQKNQVGSPRRKWFSPRPSDLSPQFDVSSPQPPQSPPQ